LNEQWIEEKRLRDLRNKTGSMDYSVSNDPCTPFGGLLGAKGSPLMFPFLKRLSAFTGHVYWLASKEYVTVIPGIPVYAITTTWLMK